MLVDVLEALKANNCVIRYKLTEQNAIPEWNEGGVELAFNELITKIKPFGLSKSHRGLLIQLLPKNKQNEIYSAFLEKFGTESNSPQ